MMNRKKNALQVVLTSLTVLSLALSVYAVLIAHRSVAQAELALSTISEVQSVQSEMFADWNQQYTAFADAINIQSDSLDEVYANQEIIVSALEDVIGKAPEVQTGESQGGESGDEALDSDVNLR